MVIIQFFENALTLHYIQSDQYICQRCKVLHKHSGSIQHHTFSHSLNLLGFTVDVPFLSRFFSVLGGKSLL